MKYLAENPNGREQLVANFLNSTEFRKLKYSKIPDTELDNVKYITTERLANNKIAKLTNQASLTANSKSVLLSSLPRRHSMRRLRWIWVPAAPSL